jgi:hypothetical protein
MRGPCKAVGATALYAEFFCSCVCSFALPCKVFDKCEVAPTVHEQFLLCQSTISIAS